MKKWEKFFYKLGPIFEKMKKQKNILKKKIFALPHLYKGGQPYHCNVTRKSGVPKLEHNFFSRVIATVEAAFGLLVS